MNKLDVLNLISKQMLEVLAKQEELAGDAFATDVPLSEIRKNYLKERRWWNEGGPRPEQVENCSIAGPHGEIPLRFCVQRKSEGLLPGIIYLHGGGYVLGNLDTHDRIMRTLSEFSGAIVIGVDYRLSPEAKFPVAIEESVAVARYLHTQGPIHGVDGNDISFAGDSGGANLSLGATLYLRDELNDCSYVKCCLLWYGMYGLKDSVSRRLLGGSWDGLTEADIKYYMESYCADTAHDMSSPYLDCLSADFSRGLPACYIASAEYDPLRDDSALLALLCAEHGIAYKHEMFDGVIHGFLHHSRILDASLSAIKAGAEFFIEQHADFAPATAK